MSAAGAASATPGRARLDDPVLEEAASVVRAASSVRPAFALILGSGLGEAVADDIESHHEVAYADLPGFPAPSVPGHTGRLLLGRLYGVAVAVFRGRIHLYEGHGVASTTLIPRLAASLGTHTLVVTNAAGGLDPSFEPGRLMVITDHLNFLGVNPLSGWRFPDGQPAFVPLSRVYDPALGHHVDRASATNQIPLLHGVYAALPGPSYETPAETRYLRSAGADAVGMSTVPEAVAGVALGLRVLGLSCITNVAGASDTHREVLAAARLAAGDLRGILKSVVPAIGAASQAEAGAGMGETG